MNFSEMPVEIWADLLEEQGEDTTELREWITSGLKVSESVFYNSDGYEYGDGDGYSDGDGYVYGYSINYGFGDGSSSEDGDGDGSDGWGNGDTWN